MELLPLRNLFLRTPFHWRKINKNLKCILEIAIHPKSPRVLIVLVSDSFGRFRISISVGSVSLCMCPLDFWNHLSQVPAALMPAFLTTVHFISVETTRTAVAVLHRLSDSPSCQHLKGFCHSCILESRASANSGFCVVYAYETRRGWWVSLFKVGSLMSLKLVAGQPPRDLPVPTSLALGLALWCS